MDIQITGLTDKPTDGWKDGQTDGLTLLFKEIWERILKEGEEEEWKEEEEEEEES